MKYPRLFFLMNKSKILLTFYLISMCLFLVLQRNGNNLSKDIASLEASQEKKQFLNFLKSNPKGAIFLNEKHVGFYSDGKTVRFEIDYDNENKKGSVVEYTVDGNVSKKFTYEDSILVGSVRKYFYDEKRRLKFEELLEEDGKHRRLKAYYDNGNLRSIINFKENKLTDPVVIYTSAGVKKGEYSTLNTIFNNIDHQIWMGLQLKIKQKREEAKYYEASIFHKDKSLYIFAHCDVDLLECWDVSQYSMKGFLESTVERLTIIDTKEVVQFLPSGWYRRYSQDGHVINETLFDQGRRI